MNQLLLGADPEVFVRQGGNLVSAHGLIQGDKANPFKVERGAVQVDGMALEFNIDPSPDEESFVGNIHAVMAQLKDMVPDYEIDISSTAEFGKEYIDLQPIEAKILGCEPDYNAYTGRQNHPPNADAPFRTAAGHVHIGWTEGEDFLAPHHFEACRLLAMELDVYLGIPSLVLDTDGKRRQLYGDPGAFRPKTYGMEYRVLSNFWLKDESYIRWVYRTVDRVFKQLQEGYTHPLSQTEDVQRYFNTPNVGYAEHGNVKYPIEYPEKVHV